jgi:hemerythrin-like domain-containing protein
MASAEIRRHFRVEEDVFYPALSRLRDAAARGAVREALEQHHNVDGLLAELESLEADDVRFADCVRRILAAFDAHVRHEEEAVFVHASGQLAPRRLEKLASQMRTRRRQAFPTQRNLEKTKG